jgi:hypothetical protein
MFLDPCTAILKGMPFLCYTITQNNRYVAFMNLRFTSADENGGVLSYAQQGRRRLDGRIVLVPLARYVA